MQGLARPGASTPSVSLLGWGYPMAVMDPPHPRVFPGRGWGCRQVINHCKAGLSAWREEHRKWKLKDLGELVLAAGEVLSGAVLEL